MLPPPHRFLLPVLALSLAASAVPSSFPRAASREVARAPASSKSVIVQIFEWSWDSIAAECTAFLGPAGYGFVQVSPPQETIQGSQWWTDYQPVSYTLTGKRGNRTQFANMITTCHTAGVKVIVDAVWNHMTSGVGTTGTAGDSYTKYNYPGTYQSQNFHYCGLEPNNMIVNYDNSTEVWTCELGNPSLADLATETEDVRSRLAAYGNDLLSLGVDGLRLDAAKQINPVDLANITSRLASRPYITQEVIWGPGQAVQPSMYTGIGDVQEFRYPTLLMQAFLNSGSSISDLQNLDNLGWVPGSGANVFVVNHDLERTSGASLNYNSPSNTYTSAMVFSLAHPYGTPTILSSYAFSTYDQGAPSSDAGTCSGTNGTNGYLCQHRWAAVSGMVGFRNTVGSASLANWVSPAYNQIAFGRGAAGFVAINNADSAWSTTFTTTLAAGTYCDVISGSMSSASTCSGFSFTISSGQFTATVPARSSIALHVGQTISRGTPTTTPATTPTASIAYVSFDATVTTVYGENVLVVGSIPELGSWSPASAIPLSPSSYPVWKVSVGIPAGEAFQYKYIKTETNGTVVWEDDPNRQDTTPMSGSQTLKDSWQ